MLCALFLTASCEPMNVAPSPEYDRVNISKLHFEDLMTEQNTFINHFLIAMPQLQGSYFANSVIYIWRHSDEGALGTVINLPMDMKLSEIFDQLDISVQNQAAANKMVLSGGPVETDKGFIIHDASTQWPSTMDVTDDIRITTSKDILADISHDEGPENYLIALGCAGWSPGQLEQEIIENSWLTCPASKEIIFSTDFADKANQAASILGFDMVQLTPNASRC